jgi:hypothetical protein
MESGLCDMKYITGQYELNLPCKLDTSGDWHQSAMNWNKVKLYESNDNIFGDYGIEEGHHIPEHEETYHAANHIRALLDLWEKNILVNG